MVGGSNDDREYCFINAQTSKRLRNQIKNRNQSVDGVAGIKLGSNAPIFKYKQTGFTFKYAPYF